jgi:hypothetical protein
MNCSQIYIGLEFALDEIESENFSVELISDGDVEFHSLKTILKQNYIYYLAPHTGCGCGWEVLNTETEYDRRSKQSLKALEIFIKATCLNQTAYILTCNQSAVGTIPEMQLETNTEIFITNLERLRPKFGGTQARLHILKS